MAAFYSKRTTRPEGQEKLQGVPSSAGVWNLHARDPYRGVTWYDTDADVVFLLAFTPHNYREFVTRWKASNLLPKPADYVDFEAHVRRLSGLDDEFIDVVEAADPDLVRRALSAPGTVVEEVLGEELAAAALLEVLVIAEIDVTGDVFLVMRFSGRLNTRKLPRDVVADLAAIRWRR